MSFQRAGDRVFSALSASPQHQGWPGRLHTGILYLAMLETANWTLYGLLGRVGVPVRTTALDTRRWIAIGENVTLFGRQLSNSEAKARVAIEARDAGDHVVAYLERDYVLPGRPEFLKRLAYAQIPPGLEDALPE
ncbi:MAG TPA: hypothetical protein VEK13_05330 [Thermoplasmata archaeon]|nr:hypothetical protein [Thermoplasmata archaeon]